MIAVEHELGKVWGLILEVEDYLQKKVQAKERADRVERALFDYLMKLGQVFLSSHFQQAGDGDVGKTVLRNGKKLKRLGQKTRKYHSIFGMIEVNRFVYAQRALQAHPCSCRETREMPRPAGEETSPK